MLMADGPLCGRRNGSMDAHTVICSTTVDVERGGALFLFPACSAATARLGRGGLVWWSPLRGLGVSQEARVSLDRPKQCWPGSKRYSFIQREFSMSPANPEEPLDDQS